MRFSIIVPVHNAAAFMRKCLDSIKTQSFKDYELIIVCDRCSDNSETVAREYADKVLITDFGNDGPPRQAGVDVAEGDWVLFLDDDDWWYHCQVLQHINDALTDTIDILLFGFIFKSRGYAAPLRKVNGVTALWPAVWNKCYRRTFIKDTRFRSIVPTPEGDAADIDWTRRIMDLAPRYGVLDEALYFYDYMRPGSQTATKVKPGGDAK